MKSDLDIKSLFPLVASAIGGCTAVVSFTFMTFVTKSEAQVEKDHAKTEQEYVRDEIKQLRSTMTETQHELNEKLDRLLYYVKGQK